MNAQLYRVTPAKMHHTGMSERIYTSTVIKVLLEKAKTLKIAIIIRDFYVHFSCVTDIKVKIL